MGPPRGRCRGGHRFLNDMCQTKRPGNSQTAAACPQAPQRQRRVAAGGGRLTCQYKDHQAAAYQACYHASLHLAPCIPGCDKGRSRGSVGRGDRRYFGACKCPIHILTTLMMSMRVQRQHGGVCWLLQAHTQKQGPQAAPGRAPKQMRSEAVRLEFGVAALQLREGTQHHGAACARPARCAMGSAQTKMQALLGTVWLKNNQDARCTAAPFARCTGGRIILVEQCSTRRLLLPVGVGILHFLLHLCWGRGKLGPHWYCLAVKRFQSTPRSSSRELSSREAEPSRKARGDPPPLARLAFKWHIQPMTYTSVISSTSSPETRQAVHCSAHAEPAVSAPQASAGDKPPQVTAWHVQFNSLFPSRFDSQTLWDLRTQDNAHGRMGLTQRHMAHVGSPAVLPAQRAGLLCWCKTVHIASCPCLYP